MGWEDVEAAKFRGQRSCYSNNNNRNRNSNNEKEMKMKKKIR